MRMNVYDSTSMCSRSYFQSFRRVTTATGQDPYRIKGVCDLGRGNGKCCFFGGGGARTREGVWGKLKDQIAAVSGAIVVLVQTIQIIKQSSNGFAPLVHPSVSIYSLLRVQMSHLGRSKAGDHHAVFAL